MGMYNLYQIGKKKRENYEKKLLKMGNTKKPSKDPDMEEYLLFSDLIDILKDLECLENAERRRENLPYEILLKNFVDKDKEKYALELFKQLVHEFYHRE